MFILGQKVFHFYHNTQETGIYAEVEVVGIHETKKRRWLTVTRIPNVTRASYIDKKTGDYSIWTYKSVYNIDQERCYDTLGEAQYQLDKREKSKNARSNL